MNMKALRWVLAATLICGGVTMPNDIKGNDKLKEAYELGNKV
jgi:hypothetical protein